MSTSAGDGAPLQEPEWLREKRALEERIRQLEAMHQQSPPQPPPTAPHPVAPLSAEHARVPTAEDVTAMAARLGELVPESSLAEANAPFLTCLSAIVTNLLRVPYNDPKYRRLRTANPKLRDELFAHPSSRPVLCELIGFTSQPDEGGNHHQEVLVLPPSDARHITLLRSIQAAIPRLVQRDEIAREATARFAAFRKGIAFELRMEKLLGVVRQSLDDQADAHGDDDDSDPVGGSTTAAVASHSGGSSEEHVATAAPAAAVAYDGAVNIGAAVPRAMREFVAAALLWGDADAALKCVDLLRKIGQNVARDPSNDKVKALRLTSAVVRETLLPSSGTVEYLLGVLGFRWSDDGLVLDLKTDDSAAVARYNARLEAGEAVLDQVTRGAEEKRGVEHLMRRRAAMEERELEKARMMASTDAAAKRNGSSSSAAAAEGGDADDDGAAAATRGGERIPIAEALKRLLGKS